ncbi:RcnB family protein [Thauera aromatica]|nr:RcnB family protein [Thauera aromatica]MCK2125469.1 RcnB family protein [Thauera aromatica]
MTAPRVKTRPKLFTALALALSGALLATPAAGEKPDWAGGGKPERTQAHPAERGKAESPNRNQVQRDKAGAGERGRRDDSDEQHTSIQVSTYFTDSHREAVRTYYSEHFHAGRCPPGLAKKHNGCMPPGLAKQWRIGRPLPRDVVYYDPPYDIMVQLGVPPEGHRFVRVAADILLVAVGTGMVVDALEDLNRM